MIRLFFYLFIVIVPLEASSIKSLSDYPFIGQGYGLLSTPSLAKSGEVTPYIPDLTHIDTKDVLYVSPTGWGSGKSEKDAASLTEIFTRKKALIGKTIIALDGLYTIKETIYLDDIHHLNLIAKHPQKARLDAQGKQLFSTRFFKSGSILHDVSIIGFEAYSTHPNSQNSANHAEFFYNAGTAKGDLVYHLYFSDMHWHDFPLVIYSGLHSHDWTVDRCLFYDGSYSYLWYMMGWHHSVINSVIYNIPYYALSIRGSYPLDEAYDYRGGNPLISSRTKHHLAKDDWTHLIANNTFGSNYLKDREKAETDARAWAHIALFYQSSKEKRAQAKEEASYFPPQNVYIYNNIFIDQTQALKDGYDRHPLTVFVDQGINRASIDSVRGVHFTHNLSDANTYPWNNTTQQKEHDIMIALECANKELKTCQKERIHQRQNHILPIEKFGLNDKARSYRPSPNSIGLEKGDPHAYFSDVDFEGKRRTNADIGAITKEQK